MEAELDLFAFDFSEDKKEMFSDENVKKQFEILQDISKESMNGYFLRIKNLPNNMVMYIDKFVENGWVKRRSNNGIYIVDDYLKFHTIDELIGMFEAAMNSVSKKPDVSWYKDFLNVINYSSSPIRWIENREEEFDKRKNDIVIKYAFKFGLNHFKEVPSSRGYKIGVISKWARENILPVIAKDVLELTTFDEVKKYFKENCFFFGRNDWERSCYSNDYQIPPFPVYWSIIPSIFETVCLVQAETEQDVKLVLEYAGRSGGSSVEEQCNIIYPKNWSFERYIDSLTDKDKELLKEDRERLKRLHGRDLLEKSPLFQYI